MLVQTTISSIEYINSIENINSTGLRRKIMKTQKDRPAEFYTDPDFCRWFEDNWMMAEASCYYGGEDGVIYFDEK